MHADSAAPAIIYRHTRLVRITHWINALSFVLLVPSGIAILLAHPEFYWGEVGYFGHPAALTLPLEPNFDHTGWGRGLHFLFAWLLVLNGLVYLLCGLINGHFRRQMLPLFSWKAAARSFLLLPTAQSFSDHTPLLPRSLPRRRFSASRR